MPCMVTKEGDTQEPVSSVIIVHSYSTPNPYTIPISRYGGIYLIVLVPVFVIVQIQAIVKTQKSK